MFAFCYLQIGNPVYVKISFLDIAMKLAITFGGGGVIIYVTFNNFTVMFEQVFLGFSWVESVHSDFIWDFGKLPFPTHLGKYFVKIGKIRAKIHEIGKIKAIFGLGMTPIYGLKNGQINSLVRYY